MESKYHLELTNLAQEDLDKILHYISIDLNNPQAAIKIIEQLHESFSTACIFPFSYPLINNELVADKTLRKIMVGNFIAFYKVCDNVIKVIRILYGMRNYANLL